MEMTDEISDEEYIEKVVDRYIKLRMRGLIISPRDWEILIYWLRRKIPLRIVMKALDIGYADFDEDRARIRTLSYITRIVRRLERERKMALVGLPTKMSSPGDEEEKEVLEEGFDRLMKKVIKLSEDKPEYEEVFVRTGENINRLKEEMLEEELDIEDCINRLSRIEDGMLLSIHNRLEDDELKRIERSAENKLNKYRGNMKEESYEKTKRAFVKHLIKVDMELPDIDPFK